MAVTPGYLVATYVTPGNNGNSYTYNRINGLSGYTVQAGDVLEYGVNWQSGPVSNLQIGIDFSTGTGAFDGSFLRSSVAVDQNGLSNHPSTDLSSFASQVWYDRSIAIGAYFTGSTIQQWWLVGEGDTNGTYVGWYREIKVTNGGVTKFVIYSNTDPAITSPSAPTYTAQGPQNFSSLTSLTAAAAVASAAAASGGGGGGSGVGNMLGGFFVGETLLGADPGADSGSGTGTGVGNMLGGFFLGETMLGGDQAAGTGGAPLLVTGFVYGMAGAITGRTTVTATPRTAISLRPGVITGRTSFVAPSLTQSSLRAGYVTCGTTVTGRLSTASFITAQSVNGRTSVSANLSKRIPPLSATTITGSTSVTGTLQRSILRGNNIYSPMYVAATLSLREQISAEGIRGSTSLTARVGIARPITSTNNILCGTTLTGNLTYASRLSGGSVVCGTTLSGSLTRSYLRGSISCGTTVTGATPTVRSAYNGLIRGKTTVAVTEGGFRRTLRSLLSTDVQTIACGTRVRGYTYVTPQDFVPIYLNTSTRVVARATLQLRFGSANLSNFVHGSTTVTGFITGLQTMVGAIRGKTTVTAKAKAGFGGEVVGFGYVSAALGVRYLLTHARVGTIVGRTTVVAARPENGTAGRAWGGTRFAYTYGTPDSIIPDPFTGKPGFYVTDQYNYHYIGGGSYVPYYDSHFPLLGVIIAIKTNKAMGGTRLNSLVIPSRAYAHNHKGPAPFYGPYGSVSLYISPKGDVGTGDFIDCQTLISGSMLTLRHRLLQILGATGLEFPGQIVFVGDAVRGIGTRTVTSGTVLQKEMAQRKPVPQNVFYV